MDIVIRRQQEQSLWVLSSIVVGTQKNFQKGQNCIQLNTHLGKSKRFVDRINVNTLVVIVQYNLQNATATSEGTGKSARNLSFLTEQSVNLQLFQ